jgi:putative Mg2+ transporter-C (MgtC) family protein
MNSELTKGASVTEVAIRLAIAVLIGGLIGWDRQRSDKPAGIRTHMLVSLGSACFTLLGFEVGEHLSPAHGPGFDPTRVLQGVIGGIGFLGAGAIIRNNGHVSGITTAAGVWVAGALGACAGVGAYVLALGTTIMAFAILTGVGLLEQRHNPSKRDDRASPPREDDDDENEVPPSNLAG